VRSWDSMQRGASGIALGGEGIECGRFGFGSGGHAYPFRIICRNCVCIAFLYASRYYKA